MDRVGQGGDLGRKGAGARTNQSRQAHHAARRSTPRGPSPIGVDLIGVVRCRVPHAISGVGQQPLVVTVGKVPVGVFLEVERAS